MIFVTLGTHELSFKRMLEYLEKMKIDEEVVIQSGNTTFESEKYKIIPFLSQSEFNNYISNSNLVITHGGVGSILTALKNKKKVIVMARLQEFNEHNDNHQLEICEKLQSDGYVISCKNFEELQEAILNYKNKDLKEYKFDNSKLLNFIVDTIDSF